MPAPGQDRQNTQSLASIDKSMRDVVKILATMNENLVKIGTNFQTFMQVAEEIGAEIRSDESGLVFDPNPQTDKSKQANELFDRAFSETPLRPRADPKVWPEPVLLEDDETS